MYKFHCPVCNIQTGEVDFANTTQMVGLPISVPKDQRTAYELHFITCNKCQTVLSTIPVPYTGKWQED